MLITLFFYLKKIPYYFFSILFNLIAPLPDDNLIAPLPDYIGHNNGHVR
jgi:hypothetical protein